MLEVLVYRRVRLIYARGMLRTMPKMWSNKKAEKGEVRLSTHQTEMDSVSLSLGVYSCRVVRGIDCEEEHAMAKKKPGRIQVPSPLQCPVCFHTHGGIAKDDDSKKDSRTFRNRYYWCRLCGYQWHAVVMSEHVDNIDHFEIQLEVRSGRQRQNLDTGSGSGGVEKHTGQQRDADDGKPTGHVGNDRQSIKA